ncbi:HupU protein [Prosthecomicrobium hirschii]|uniref:NADH-quinone oxidoreductase subunit B family protein n=1 Tax=Prosthecodimorpha hirschii TaxID=665126 RepID=UPI00221F4235|nr:HupU protein [Prosthecomicrobium hirschii]MCW1841935.1 HupU protein [Prosthecomicrobium hirschii]
MADRSTLLWLQAGSCGGCTMAVLECGARGWSAELDAVGIDLVWHPSVSLATGAEVIERLERIESGAEPLDILCLEGAVLCGPNGTGRFNRFAGTGRTMLDWVRALAPRAGTVVAVGSCAAFGGIPAGDPDPTDARGLQHTARGPGGVLGTDFRARSGMPVINVSGCAPHPGWIMETLEAVAAGLIGPADLDALGRPRFFADHLAHHGCSRNEFYEFKASAERPSDRGCMMENLGCKATQAVGDCNQRSWNGGGTCTDGGYACVACTAPGFENTRGFLATPKIAGIPVGLPLDMPKAWFVALAALSKSATPKRVRDNARADRPVVPPGRGPGTR